MGRNKLIKNLTYKLMERKPCKCATTMPNKYEIQCAIGSFGGEKFKTKKALEKIDEYWVHKTHPKAGDWLWEQNEQGQCYPQFTGNKNAVLSSGKNVIYIVPIKRKENSVINKKLLQDYKKMIKAFYYGVKVQILKNVYVEDLVTNEKLEWSENEEQFNSKKFLSWINVKYGYLKKNYIGIISIIDEDLFCDELNYVFGLACPMTQVGISSVVRYTAKFTEEEFDYNTFLMRTLKTTLHEIGHMFGLLHCIYYECNMNGSNNLEKSDIRPIYFCPVCYRKLSYC